MSSMSISNDRISSPELGLFQQIALFSVSGLTMSMAFVFVGGLRIMYPWFQDLRHAAHSKRCADPPARLTLL